MNWGNLVSFSIVGILIGVLLFFLIKEYIRVKKNKLSTIEISFLGIFTLGMFILFDYFTSGVVKDFEIYFFVSISLIPIIGLLINPKLVYYAMIGIFISLIIKNENWLTFINYIPFIQVAMISIITIGVTTTKILNKNYGFKLIASNLILLLTWLFSSVLILIFNFDFIKDISNIFILLLFLLLTSFFVSIIIYWIEKIYDSYNKLETFKSVDRSSFYKVSTAQEKINSLIQKKRYQFGLITTFTFSEKDQKKLLPILNKMTTELEENYSNITFFKSNGNMYSSFLPLNYSQIDLAKFRKSNFEKIDDIGYLTEFQNTLIKLNSEKLHINAYSSLYGVDSFDLNSLIFRTHEMIKNIMNKKNSIMYFYDFSIKQKTLYERSLSFSLLPKEIINLEIKFIKSIYYPNIYYYEDVSEKIDENLIMLAERYLSLKALKDFEHFEDSKLVIRYPADIISNNKFDIEKFVGKIEKITNISNVIIGIKPNNNKNLIQKVNTLKEKGFEFAFLNADVLEDKLIENFNFEYFLTKENEFSIKNIFNNSNVSNMPLNQLKLNAKKL